MSSSRILRRTALLAVVSLSSAALPPPAGAAGDGVVREVLFSSPTCPYCRKVREEILPPLSQRFEGRFQVAIVSTATRAGRDLYWSAYRRYGVQARGVPLLVIGDFALVGPEEIPRRLPELVSSYLASGGTDWPPIPGLDTLLAASTPEPALTPVPAPPPTPATASWPTPTPRRQRPSGHHPPPALPRPRSRRRSLRPCRSRSPPPCNPAPPRRRRLPPSRRLQPPSRPGRTPRPRGRRRQRQRRGPRPPLRRLPPPVARPIAGPSRRLPSSRHPLPRRPYLRRSWFPQGRTRRSMGWWPVSSPTRGATGSPSSCSSP
jgi:hypothetical protein